MQDVALVVPGRIDERTGGYHYDRRMAEGLARLGRQVTVVELDASFPAPTVAALRDAGRALANLPTGSVALVDSLALGAMPDLVAREASRLRIVALMHLPLAADPTLAPGAVERVAEGERRALQACTRVVITGEAATVMIAPYELPADRVVVVEPGTDRAPLARGSRALAGPGPASVPLELLCVATVNPIKGHELLLEALAAASVGDWRLTCAGSLTRDPATVARVRAGIARLGLEGRVVLAGDLDADALAERWDRADLFVLATRLETYGMAVAESLARGIPVVATSTGAIPQLVGEHAGLVVPVDDRAALTSALSRLLEDPAQRARLAEGARRVRDRLPTWDEQAVRMAAVLEPLTA